MSRRARALSLFGAAVLIAVPTSAAGHPDQHGAEVGHLTGTGEFGVIEHVRTVRLTSNRTGEAFPDMVADVAVDPNGHYAYVANWGEMDCDAAREGGAVSPDAGAYVIDIDPLESAHQVGFIPSSMDSRPGEGMQVLDITTKFFSGTVLVMNNELCGAHGRGGISLWDVSTPERPLRLGQHFGDSQTPGFVNEIHSAFAWDTGDSAYAVMTDNYETSDVDILDITNPRRPRLIRELDLNAFSRSLGNPIWQPELGLDDSGLHDMIVKRIGTQWVMLLSYWDGGYVQLNVNDPANPTFISDTDYTAVDPELADPSNANVPSDSRDIAPEGNAHQAEYTADNEMFIGTDEDFAPFRPSFAITSGSTAGSYPAGEFGWTRPIDTLPTKSISGTTVYVGYACPQSAPLAHADSTGVPDGQQIAVAIRGPVSDPSANYEACFFSEKVEAAQNAGYDAVIIANHHTGAQAGEAPDAKLCGSKGHDFTATIPGLCIGHRGLHLLFDSVPAYGVPVDPSREPAVGTVGAAVSAITEFDGWGYVHLFDRQSAASLDTFAIEEAMDPAYAHGFGDLTVHEVATDPVEPRQAYLSYYAGGIVALDIVCADPADESTCSLQEVGGYLDPAGNDFWGVEAFRPAGSSNSVILGSDRASGLWIFRRT